MRVQWLYWRPWDQSRALANARIASTELCRSRAEREEVDIYLARLVDEATEPLRA
jgi:hypothetical protein